jgi:hypothetical protein
MTILSDGDKICTALFGETRPFQLMLPMSILFACYAALQMHGPGLCHQKTPNQCLPWSALAPICRCRPCHSVSLGYIRPSQTRLYQPQIPKQQDTQTPSNPWAEKPNAPFLPKPLPWGAKSTLPPRFKQSQWQCGPRRNAALE